MPGHSAGWDEQSSMAGGTQKGERMEEVTGSTAQGQPHGDLAQGPWAEYCVRRDRWERVGHVQGTAGAWLQLNLRRRWQIHSTSPPLLLFIVDV